MMCRSALVPQRGLARLFDPAVRSDFARGGRLTRAVFWSLVAALPLWHSSATSHAAPWQDQADGVKQLHGKFKQAMRGVKLVGQFTIAGRESQSPKKEEYTILGVTKMEKGDYWLINARLKYLAHDVTVPIPLEVKWAGDTPVLTLTKLAIPGLGTFSARVVIHEGKYAGTWTHDQVSGHLFGTIQKVADK